MLFVCDNLLIISCLKLSVNIFLIFISRFVGLFQPVSATCINITGIQSIVNVFFTKKTHFY